MRQARNNLLRHSHMLHSTQKPKSAGVRRSLERKEYHYVQSITSSTKTCFLSSCSGLQMYTYLVKILEDNYPEMVKRLFAINGECSQREGERGRKPVAAKRDLCEEA